MKGEIISQPAPLQRLSSPPLQNQPIHTLEIPPLNWPPPDLLYWGNIWIRQETASICAAAHPWGDCLPRVADTQIEIPGAGPGLPGELQQGAVLHAPVKRTRQRLRDHCLPPRSVQLALDQGQPWVGAGEVLVMGGTVFVTTGEVHSPQGGCGILQRTLGAHVQGTIRGNHEQPEQGQASFCCICPGRGGREQPCGALWNKGRAGGCRGVWRGPAPREHLQGDGKVGTWGDIQIVEHGDSKLIPGMREVGWTDRGRESWGNYCQNCAHWIS
jgi:hypothetical protein